MTFAYTANTQTYNYSNYNANTDQYSSSINFNISLDNYDATYKIILDQTGTTLSNTANTVTALADVMELLRDNIEQIKVDVSQIQADIASLEDRGKSDRKGIVTSSSWWGTDCNLPPATDNRYRKAQVISIIDNLKECGLYEDFLSEINNPTEM